MKKIIALIAVAIMALMGTCALSEDVKGAFEDGNYVIRIPAKDDGWEADDMSQDDSVVKLVSAETADGVFTAAYAPVSDGEMTISVKHMDGIACDEAHTFDLKVTDNTIESVGGSYTAAPAEEDLDAVISGEWQINDNIMAGMTIEKNPGTGWALQIATAYPDVHVLRANMFYDCELDEFVYADGAFYESEITNSPEVVIGDEVASDVYGTITLAPQADGTIHLVWYNALSPEETAEFYRPEGYEGSVAPQFDGLDITNATCPVSFNRDDLKDGVLANVHIFTEDTYDIVDVAQMKIGDSFEAEGKTVTIDSLETDEFGNININGGFEKEGGYTLTTDEDTNGWTTTSWDDFCTYTERDTVDLTLAENVIFNDSWDTEADPVTAEGIEAVAKAIMESENDSFYEHNTELVIEDGKVIEFNRHYVP